MREVGDEGWGVGGRVGDFSKPEISPSSHHKTGGAGGERVVMGRGFLSQ